MVFSLLYYILLFFLFFFFIGLLVICHSLGEYPHFSAQLIDFLLLSIEYFNPMEKKWIEKGVVESFKTLTGLGVVKNIHFFFNHPAFDNELHQRIERYLSPFKNKSNEIKNRNNDSDNNNDSDSIIVDDKIDDNPM